MLKDAKGIDIVGSVILATILKRALYKLGNFNFSKGAFFSVNTILDFFIFIVLYVAILFLVIRLRNLKVNKK
jgi:hypothetical protein